MTDQQSPYASGPSDPSDPSRQPPAQAYPPPVPEYGYAEPVAGLPAAQPGYAVPPPGQQPYGQPGHGQPGHPPPDYGYGYGYGYGHPAYGQPGYGVDPVSGQPWSEKSRTTAGLLSLLLPLVGVCGVGRLYAGNIGLGLAQLIGLYVGVLLTPVLVGFVIIPAVWIWAVVDGIVLLTNGGKDGTGRPLR